MYKDGMKVRLLGAHEISRDMREGLSHDMEKFFGKVVTISKYRPASHRYGVEAHYLIYEDKQTWRWFEDLIKCQVLNYEESDLYVEPVRGKIKGDFNWRSLEWVEPRPVATVRSDLTLVTTSDTTMGSITTSSDWMDALIYDDDEDGDLFDDESDDILF